MNSIGSSCNEIKKQYDNCFNAWFSERFLKGDTNDSICAPMLKLYQQCVKACKELKEKYEQCFNAWFAEKFLKGNSNDSSCAKLLKVYTECVAKAMKEQNIDLQDIEENYLKDEKKDKKTS